jgi:hypothetical protein
MKICSKCKQEKSFNEFSKDNSREDGLVTFCKACKAKYDKDRYECNKAENIKSNLAVKDLGCSVDDFKKYIESLFQPGMTWENRGHGVDKWQLDHKIALCRFDLTKREQFLIAAHYTNLQPLWHEEHLKKSIEDKKKSLKRNAT